YPRVQIFNELTRRLKSWSLLHGQRPPILIVDEVHSFKRATDEGLLEGKQCAFIDTVAAKDHHTCSLNINPIDYHSIVLGDLSREEAHLYFLNVVENHPHLSQQKKDTLRSVEFDIPFKLTGGRIPLIQEYVQQVYVSGYLADRIHYNPREVALMFFIPLTFQPCNFRVVQHATTVMRGDFHAEAKTYGRKEAVEISNLLINSSSGYLTHSSVPDKFGSKVIEAMIARNFLHYRPLFIFPMRDLVPTPSKGVVTAPSVAALRALEGYVKRFDAESTVLSNDLLPSTHIFSITLLSFRTDINR
ncbi:hypothetical protein PSTT_16661, partial [Puccinia striiformis]